MTAIIGFIIVFGILVIVHEYGHYIVAKRSGVLVREFSIGFGPKIYHHRSGETTYTVRLLPLGGYVRLAGDEEEADIRPGMPVILTMSSDDTVTVIDTSKDSNQQDGLPMEVTDIDLVHEMYIKGHIPGEDGLKRYSVARDADIVEEDGTIVQVAPIERQIQSAPLINRMLTNLAGPVNNIILAILIYMVIAFISGGVINTDPVVGQVLPDGAAAETSLQDGDVVNEINDELIESWPEITQIIAGNPEEELVFNVTHEDGNTEDITLVPNAVETENGQTVGEAGIQADMKTSILDKIIFGFTQTWLMIKGLVLSVWQMVTGAFSLDNLGGPVAIFALTEAAVDQGILSTLNFMAYLSVNLGVLNMLPIPALDGGKILLNIVEGVRGKPVSQTSEAVLTLIGVGLLFLLMIAVTWNDIQRFFFN